MRPDRVARFAAVGDGDRRSGADRDGDQGSLDRLERSPASGQRLEGSSVGRAIPARDVATMARRRSSGLARHAAGRRRCRIQGVEADAGEPPVASVGQQRLQQGAAQCRRRHCARCSAPAIRAGSSARSPSASSSGVAAGLVGIDLALAVDAGRAARALTSSRLQASGETVDGEGGSRRHRCRERQRQLVRRAPAGRSRRPRLTSIGRSTSSVATGCACSTVPAHSISRTNGKALPSIAGSSAPLISTRMLSISQAAKRRHQMLDHPHATAGLRRARQIDAVD